MYSWYENGLVFLLLSVGGVVAIAMFIVFIMYKVTEIIDRPLIQRIKLMGYDTDDVEVFLDGIGQDYENFLKSKGLRLQYELFKDGKSSDYIHKAKANKESEDAKSSGYTTGVATGMVIGSSIRR